VSSYYTVTVALGIFSMLVMLCVLLVNDTLPLDKKRGFAWLFIAIALAASCEWLGMALDGVDGWGRTLHAAVKMVEFSLVPTFGVAGAYVLGAPHGLKAIAGVLIVNAALEFLSTQFGFIFYIDAAAFYRHGDLYWIYALFDVVGVIYLLVTSVRFTSRFQSRKNFILFLILALMIAGVVAQTLDSTIRVDWMCIPIGMTLFYIYYSEMALETDELTSLLNRRSFDGRLSRMDRPCVLVFFDVDDFKHVNDEHGHAVGDRCLELIGRAMVETYSSSGRCYRIGGDEFCAIIERDLDSVDEMNSAFFNRMELERRESRWLPWVSIGYSAFDPKTSDITTTLERADHMMYHYKDERHIGAMA
jgi:diguanylate cyclase (GGDEF)-like protein